LSLVWLHRADYARAGYRMLPVVDASGRLTCLTIILYWLALMPLGLAATFCGLSGCLFAAASLLMGMGLFLLALQFRAAKTEQNARRMVWASIAYLPLLLALLVADRPSQKIHDREQHAPNRVEEMPVDGRVADAGVVARGVAAGPRAAGHHG
jgi:heme O synthase-like polyprenyltransferase